MSRPAAATCARVADFRAACEGARQAGRRVALVLTMGALHRGHASLIRHARTLGEFLAVTIFVNPAQFGKNEDLDRYPRTIESDLEACAAEGVDLVFVPSVLEMYPPGETTRVSVAGLDSVLCGASRPGHFTGVATVVAKFFACSGPCSAVFGRKDYQQLKVIERLVRDLLLPVAVVGVPTVREADGLALSSRNAYLSESERSQASAIPRALSVAVQAYAGGERRAGTLRDPVETALSRAGLAVDYVRMADPKALALLPDSVVLSGPTLLAVAAFAGKTRLIDNVVLGEDPDPVARGTEA